MPTHKLQAAAESYFRHVRKEARNFKWIEAEIDIIDLSLIEKGESYNQLQYIVAIKYGDRCGNSCLLDNFGAELSAFNLFYYYSIEIVVMHRRCQFNGVELKKKNVKFN